MKRMPEILALYGENDISDRQWEDIIRTAYANIGDSGVFEKARFVDVGRSWYILIIANRKGRKLVEIFSRVEVSDDSRYDPLPSLRLDDKGVIVFEDGGSPAGQDEELTGGLRTSRPVVRSTIAVSRDTHLKESAAAREIEIAPVDEETTISSTGEIFEKILGAEGPDKLEIFSTRAKSCQIIILIRALPQGLPTRMTFRQ